MPSIKALAKDMGSDNQGAAYKAYKELLTIVMRAGDPENDRRASVAAELAAELNARGEPKKDRDGKERPGDPIHSKAVRNKLARLLSHVGGAAEVPALVEAMRDLDLREMARFSLQRNPSEAATDALIAFLDESVGRDFRVGVVCALGQRQGAKVLATLRQATKDEAKPVRIAAVEALARYPDASHDALIAKVTKADCAHCRCRANIARVQLAETLRNAGDKDAARRIYTAIRRSDAPEPQKKAAEIALHAMG